MNVSDDKFVVTNIKGEKVTKFKNYRNNTQSRIMSGRWVPK